MFDGYRNAYLEAGRVKQIARAAAIALFAALLFGSFAHWVGNIKGRREALQSEAETACAQRDKQACQIIVAARAAHAADDTVDLGLWQFWAGLVGIGFVALTLRATRESDTRHKALSRGSPLFDEKFLLDQRDGTTVIVTKITNCGPSRIRIVESCSFWSENPIGANNRGISPGPSPQNSPLLDNRQGNPFDAAWPYLREINPCYYGLWLVYIDVFGDTHAFSIAFVYDPNTHQFLRMQDRTTEKWLMVDAKPHVVSHSKNGQHP